MKLDKIRFARLIAYLAPMMKFQLDNTNIEQLDDLIDIEAPDVQHNYPSNADISELMRLMAAGTQKIEAIRLHRKLTGMRLKDSKDEVEQYWPVKSINKALMLEVLDSRTSLLHDNGDFNSEQLQLVRNFIVSFD